MAEEVARVTGCTVALPINYGAHPYHHVGMPGTVIIPDRVLIDYIMSIMVGFWNAGFRKQILLNGHGQEWVIPCAIHDFAKKYQVPGIYIMLHWWYAAGQGAMDKKHGGPFDFPLVHACEVEGSFIEALAPDMVKQEDLVDVEVRQKYIKGEGHFNDPCESSRNTTPAVWEVRLSGTPKVIWARLQRRVKRRLSRVSKRFWTTWRSWYMTYSNRSRLEPSLPSGSSLTGTVPSTRLF
jgi:creatinine amidohydrolase/Fe(II)-dependent formamide hydrolase-like protein